MAAMPETTISIGMSDSLKEQAKIETAALERIASALEAIAGAVEKLANPLVTITRDHEPTLSSEEVAAIRTAMAKSLGQTP
jgi:hypothetical protein